MRTQTLTIFAALGSAPLVLAADPYPITGVSVPEGTEGVPLRLNINDLQAAGGPQWDLYIRALSDMQRADYHDDLSYFQISGIHGRPYIEYNNTGEPSYDDWGGYCPHGEPLFLSWHRPYLLLFEQVLVSRALEIAQTYPESHRQEYMQAAETLRSPFWDWAADSTVPPASVPAKLSVNFPDGDDVQERQIDNPLATYTMPPAVLQGEYGTFDPSDRPRILHCPAPDSEPASANTRLAQVPYRQLVYDLFTRGTNFTDFATVSNSVVPLELLHNNIHWDAACGQQFVTPDLAGFDPLFMLHHGNIDRIWSYWQAINPDKANFEGSYPGLSRFTSRSGTIITPESPLMPFFGPDAEVMTTESVASIQGFGYSYEGLEYWEKNAEQMAQDSKDIINRLFDRAHVPKPCQIQVHVRGKHASSLVVAAQPATGFMSAGVPLDKVTETTEINAMSALKTAELIQADLKVTIIKLDGSTIDSVKSLEVKLEDVMVNPPPAGHKFPQYGSSTIRPINAKAALKGHSR